MSYLPQVFSQKGGFSKVTLSFASGSEVDLALHEGLCIQCDGTVPAGEDLHRFPPLISRLAFTMIPEQVLGELPGTTLGDLEEHLSVHLP